jgi:hypothetical protein
VEHRREPNFSYRLLRMIYPVFRALLPNQVIRADDLARAMVDVTIQKRGERGGFVFENRDIRAMVESPRHSESGRADPMASSRLDGEKQWNIVGDDPPISAREDWQWLSGRAMNPANRNALIPCESLASRASASNRRSLEREMSVLTLKAQFIGVWFLWMFNRSVLPHSNENPVWWS